MKIISYQPAALKTLGKIPKNDSNRIIDKIETYSRNPDALANNVIKLKNRDGIRLRVGNWRVIMKDEEVLLILQIGSRGSIYDE